MYQQFDRRISGVDYSIWARSGTVSGVIQKSETHVWSSGGGGYVDPKYGGAVQAPTVHSRTDHWKQVRVDGDDGKAYTVNLHDSINAFPNDRVSIIWGAPKKDETGYVHGFKNHREGTIWSFDCEQMVKPQLRQTIGGLIFRFWSKSIFSFAAALAIATVIMALTLDPVWVLLQPWVVVQNFPYIFQMFMPQILGSTIAVAIAVKIAYSIMRGIASNKAGKVIRGLSGEITDRPVTKTIDSQPAQITKAA